MDILDSVDSLRKSWYQKTNDLDLEMQFSCPQSQRAAYWLGHKVVAILSVTLHAIHATGCAVAASISIMTIGVLKVAVFALTLGHIKPQVSTGVLFLQDRTWKSTAEMAIALWEVFYHLCALSIHSYDQGKKIASALRVEWVVNRVESVICTLLKRGTKALQNTLSDERIEKGQELYFWPLTYFRDETERTSCFTHKGRQSFSIWCQHKLFAAINISLNGTILLVAGSGFVATTVAVFAKTAFHTVTDKRVETPTGWGYSAGFCNKAIYLIARDLYAVSTDFAILAYNAVDSLRVVRQMVKVSEVIYYVPPALFS